MFYNVEYMDLPSELLDLKIDEPNEADLAFVKARIGRLVDTKRVFILKSGDHRHVVVAGNATIAETGMGVFESPFALPQVKLKDSK